MKILTLLVLLSTFAFIVDGQSKHKQPKQQKQSVRQKTNDVTSDESLAAEMKQLQQMTSTNKAKVKEALELLQDAMETAALSTDTEEIAGISHRASDATTEAVKVLPKGVLNGAVIACNKALEDSFILRLAYAGGLDSSNKQVAQKLQEIILRYQLARVDKVERVAKILDFAEFHIRIAKKGAFLASMIDEDPENEN